MCYPGDDRQVEVVGVGDEEVIDIYQTDTVETTFAVIVQKAHPIHGVWSESY